MCKVKTSNTGYKGISISKQGSSKNIILRLKVNSKIIKTIMISDNKNYSGNLDHTTFKNALRILLDLRSNITGEPFDTKIDYDTGISYIKKYKLNVLGVELDNEPETPGDIIQPHIKHIDTDNVVREDNTIKNMEAELKTINARKAEIEKMLEAKFKEELEAKRIIKVNEVVNKLSKAEDRRNQKLAECSSVVSNLKASYTELLSVLENEISVSENSMNVLTDTEHLKVIKNNIVIDKTIIDKIKTLLSKTIDINDVYNDVANNVCNDVYDRLQDKVDEITSKDNTKNIMHVPSPNFGVNNGYSPRPVYDRKVYPELTTLTTDMLISLNGLSIEEMMLMVKRLMTKLNAIAISLQKPTTPVSAIDDYNAIVKRINAVRSAMANYSNKY